eukprot:CAMPEP_0114477076 /NCGR_PEP_ID=MMETSP0104-20121206/15141_1 /TAXON_ID=37642 ORGANISM="Paraphysomonas imperforata, Strain PA2" /NCGR_SAMPLE_ID=MMETSP0104 /ASSEMBLY_ACC=CAM_ASM_000202 /LENGTH=907 /DNA_ID=CAMNT_0001651941 /DNA_START=12 /DNA_END=2735 /DNA_ORIENTATION=+
MGPEPVLLSRKEVDMLYITFKAVTDALAQLGVDYIVTGGSLLGAVRQHSILFCDDDIDIAIIDREGSGAYDHVSRNLQSILGSDFIYSIRPWEGGDRIRPKQMSSIFLDLFTIRCFESMEQLVDLIGVKKNGKPQSEEYVNGIIDKIVTSAHSQGEDTPLCPFWHFNTRKAVEMWAKEVYRDHEMFPLSEELKLGPHVGVKGPHMPVKLLKRAFGLDCFEVYFQSGSHKDISKSQTIEEKVVSSVRGTAEESVQVLPPMVQAGGTWEGGRKTVLREEHYFPMQPVLKTQRRPTLHSKEMLFAYLEEQTRREAEWEVEVKTSMAGKQKRRTPGVESTQHSHMPLPVSLTDTSTVSPILPLTRPRRTVYMDGVFDLFHIGHLEAIRQCAALGDRVVIGVTGDADATGYKRPPIISEANRVAIVEALREVDQVVCPCPLIITEQVMVDLGIDLVVHGFASDADAAKQEEFFALPMKTGRFQRIDYYNGLSTTDIIRKIQDSDCGSEEVKEQQECLDCLVTPSSTQTQTQKQTRVQTEAQELIKRKPQWFGAAMAAATNCSSEICTTPFPLELRVVMEPFVRKATMRRHEVLEAVRAATGASTYDAVMSCFRGDSDKGWLNRCLASEGDFSFNTTQHMLREAFMNSSGLPGDMELSRLHENPDTKDDMFANLTRAPGPFQEAFDRFVTEVCAPHMAAMFECDEIYYQAFPCIRVVQPDEFSIGPHADVAYGHHPCSINYYLPLTHIGGASSLFLESRPGSEDWHPIVGKYGHVKHFSGAMCAHWTTENKTSSTRVSLDFRMIPGPLFEALQCGGAQKGGQLDVYRQRPGYYSCCQRGVGGNLDYNGGRSLKNEGSRAEIGAGASSTWTRQGPLLSPDERVGFPWTVKDMDKFVTKSKAKRHAGCSSAKQES